MNLNPQFRVTFPKAQLVTVPSQVVGEAPEEWISRTAEVNKVFMKTRADERLVWNFATSVVHPPYRFSLFIEREVGEPDPAQFEVRGGCEISLWEEWVEGKKKEIDFSLHEDCCVAHGCLFSYPLCPILKHFMKQEKRCPVCPDNAQLLRGSFNDADVYVLQEWNILSCSTTEAFDELCGVSWRTT